MSVIVNGEPRDAAGTTIGALVSEIARSPKGIAVALNGEIVPRSLWEETLVRDSDQVEVLGAAQGG